MTRKKLYTKGEEIFNAVSHIVGAVFGVAVLVIGVILSTIYLDTIGVVAMVIYGASMVIMFTASSLYHFLRSGKTKNVFQILDHCSIFILIAGTYTPFTLIALLNVGIWGWLIFTLVWSMAIIGIVANSINMHNKTVKKFSMGAYLVMGWICLIAIVPIVETLPLWGVLWTLFGGIAYTAGVYFFVKKRKYYHSIWHLFILAGAAMQFVAIVWHVILV